MKNLDFNLESLNSEIRNFVETNHYSKSINGVKISYCFTLRDMGELVGVILYGQMSTTAWKKFVASESDLLELRRMVLLLNDSRNVGSWFISKTIKWLKINTKIKRLVSYADPNHGHIGFVYQSSNWSYEGKSSNDSGFIDIETGKKYHSRALRTKYKGNFKPFVLRLREKLVDGKLEKIILLGKHTYTYNLREKNNYNNKYPKE